MHKLRTVATTLDGERLDTLAQCIGICYRPMVQAILEHNVTLECVVSAQCNYNNAGTSAPAKLRRAAVLLFM